MRTIYAEYNINHDSIDVYTSAGYMLRIDCWKAEKNLKTTYGSECALTSLAVDEPLEYARLYLDGNLQMWFLNFFQLPSNQCEAYIQHLCKHQYYRGLYYILHKLFSSYLISIFF